MTPNNSELEKEKLRRRVADIFVDAHEHKHWTCIPECLDHEKTGTPINKLLALLHTETQRAVEKKIKKYLPLVDELVDFYGAYYDGNPPNHENVAEEMRHDLATINQSREKKS